MTQPPASPAASPRRDVTASVPHGNDTRIPAGYLPALGAANFGIYLALLTPVFVSMAFKLQHITATPAESVSALGLVTGVGSLFAIVFNPLVGRLSDRTTSRFGMRRPWLIGGSLTGLAALALIGVATEVWVVLIGWCAVQAALNGVLAAFTATVPDHVPVRGRGRASGVIGLTTSLGILGGSFFVTFLSDDFSRFVVPGLVATALTVTFALVLKDRVQPPKPAEPYGLKEFLGSFVFNPVKHRDFGWAWITTFLVMFGYAGVATFLPLYLTERFQLGEQEAITTVLWCTLASTIAQAMSSPAAGMLSDRLGKRRMFVTVAGAIMVVGLVVTAFAPNVIAVIIGQAVVGLGVGAFLSVSLALATQVLPNPDDVAKDLGVWNIANALPQSIAPAIGPVVIAFGASTAIGGYALFYLIGAVASLAAAALVYRIKGVA